MKKQKAFTLAEVLITLVVVGIISVLTVPVLLQSTENKQYIAAKEKALMTIGQAGRKMAMNGTLVQSGIDTETFVKNYFSKYVKIAKMCGSGIDNLEDCGISKDVVRFNDNTKVQMPTTIAGLSSANSRGVNNASRKTNYAFTLVNGYSVNFFYNPNCTNDINTYDDYALSYICINAIYDMNGLKNQIRLEKT